MSAIKDEKSGCLSTIFPFLKRSTEEAASETLPYRVRDDFLSPSELSFYRVLSSLIGTRFIIQSKVRLADIFFVARPNENATYFNKIAQKHLDFLLCDTTTMKPIFGVELDDSSHQRTNRQERDEFVSRVFETAGLPLLRLPVQREYNSREISAQLALLLKDKNEVITPTQSETNKPGGSVPICPKCSIQMVLRTVSQGEHKGKQFFGCQNYPRCREVKSVQAG